VAQDVRDAISALTPLPAVNARSVRTGTTRHTAHQLSAYLDDPLWDDFEDLLGEIVCQVQAGLFLP
jgi:hypothetical protein